jgi:glycosyltransferase involved in cell wall biosynthesis
MRKALFLTYDGLLDPLGGSQILPYLRAISGDSLYLHIVSFEKPASYVARGSQMRAELSAIGIGWSPISFTAIGLFGKLGKLWDLANMYLRTIWLQRQHKFSIIHCRSYQAMQVGCFIKKLFGAKTLFDMRGLWVDERVDGGIWPQDRWVNRASYAAYKKIEKRLLACADHVIALTKRVVPELRHLAPKMTSRLTVIPCCADYNLFTIASKAQRLELRAKLGLNADARVIAYLGSLGTWYMLDQMLHFFGKAQNHWGNVHFLMITRDWKPEHDGLVTRIGLSAIRDRIHVKPAVRTEIPALLSCADVMLSFIKPAYSKIASSPTKLAEAFAVGVPVISNTGIGDVDEITLALDAGALVDLSDENSFNNVVARLDTIAAKGGKALRERSRASLGLEVAAARYRRIYRELEDAR